MRHFGEAKASQEQSHEKPRTANCCCSSIHTFHSVIVYNTSCGFNLCVHCTLFSIKSAGCSDFLFFWGGKKHSKRLARRLKLQGLENNWRDDKSEFDVLLRGIQSPVPIPRRGQTHQLSSSHLARSLHRRCFQSRRIQVFNFHFIGSEQRCCKYSLWCNKSTKCPRQRWNLVFFINTSAGGLTTTRIKWPDFQLSPL